MNRFHLFFTFLQLFIFGMLSATTLGYDVTTYISHSPGMPTLQKGDESDDMEPQIYADRRTAYLSMLVFAIAFAATRIIHLIQYARVCWCAIRPIEKPSLLGRQFQDRFSPPQSEAASQTQNRPSTTRIPMQLKAIMTGLLISNVMLIAALVVTASNFGQTVRGASCKLGLWIVGFSIEIISHFVTPLYLRSKGSNAVLGDPEGGETVQPRLDRGGHELPVSSETKLEERLQTIIAIILGEGINGIAETLSAILGAPGVGRPLVFNIVSTACIIWCIAYIYFESPQEVTAPQSTSWRFMPWVMLHLASLAATVLLLIGIKGQFLLTCFLSALFKTTNGFNRIYQEQLMVSHNDTVWRTNVAMKHFLLERGIVWLDEYNKLADSFGNTTEAEQYMLTPAWSVRLSLTIVLNLFKDFNGGDDSIPSNIQPNITEYYTNLTLAFKVHKLSHSGKILSHRYHHRTPES
ncbi:hypothetical protein FRC11_012288 [Ceratobasidium sp. 423]|nr:hypothetical protein FRC11_012288 [Ceratobasidium sp. 423]